MFGIMMGVLPPLAKFLAQQPIGDKGEHAAAAFNYYYFEPSRSALAQLQDEMDAAINAYVGVTEETPDQVAVYDYGAILESLLPIKASIDSLLDLESFKKLDGITTAISLTMESDGQVMRVSVSTLVVSNAGAAGL